MNKTIDNRLTKENKNIVSHYVRLVTKHLEICNPDTYFNVSTDNNIKSALIITNVNGFVISDIGKSTIVSEIRATAAKESEYFDLISDIALKNAKYITKEFNDYKKQSGFDTQNNQDFKEFCNQYTLEFIRFAKMINGDKINTDTLRYKIDLDNKQVIYRLFMEGVKIDLTVDLENAELDNKKYLNELVKSSYLQLLNLYAQTKNPNQLELNVELLIKRLTDKFKQNNLFFEIEETIAERVYITITDKLKVLYSVKIPEKEVVKLNRQDYDFGVLVSKIYKNTLQKIQ